MVRSATYNAGFPVATTDFTIAEGETLSDAHDLGGEGVAGLWVGPTSATSITPLHAPPADDEPAAAAFEPFYRLVVGDAAASAVTIPLPAAASAQRVYVQLEPGIIWRAHWLKLQQNAAAGAGGETVYVDAVTLVSP